jgi:hypothetical protein
MGVVDLGDGFAPADSCQLFSAKQARQKSAAVTKLLTDNKLQASQWQIANRKLAHANAS